MKNTDIKIGTLTLSESTAKGVTKKLTHAVAAWSTEYTASAGVYDIRIAIDTLGKVSCYAVVDGVISSNYTPSLFGGVRCGSRDGSEDVGKLVSFDAPIDFPYWLHNEGNKNSLTCTFDRTPELNEFLAAAKKFWEKSLRQNHDRCFNQLTDASDRHYSMVAHYAKDCGHAESKLRLIDLCEKKLSE